MRRSVLDTYQLDVDGMRVTVVRTQVKRINLRVNEHGVRMSVPRNCSRAKAEQFARQNVDWMRRALSARDRRDETTNVTFENGSSSYVWGDPVVVRIVEVEGKRDCALEDGELVLRVHAGDDAAVRASLVEQWRKEQIEARLQCLRPAAEERVGRAASAITLRRMKTRWGSCTTKTGRIRLSTTLSEYPPECLEAVLVHELCHLREANHGPRFYALMDLHYPGWRAAWRTLRQGHIKM